MPSLSHPLIPKASYAECLLTIIVSEVYRYQLAAPPLLISTIYSADPQVDCPSVNSSPRPYAVLVRTDKA